MTLRPMTNLEDVTLAVKVTGGQNYARNRRVDYVRRIVGEAGADLPKDAHSGREVYCEAVSLTGHTVSALTKLHKRLTAAKKEAAKLCTYRPCADDIITIDFQFGGDAEGYDFAKLAKLPTPQEDWDVLRKLRNKSDLTNKQWGRAFALMGYDAVPIKSGRKITGFTVGGVEYNETPSNYGRPTKWTYAPEEARAAWVARASELLGLPDPALTVGLPLRARDYRTDLSIRTCPCCFRDIKASGHTHGLMADHGFTIDGRDWSGWGGERQGGCPGVGLVPWERSPDGCEMMLRGTEKHAARLERDVARLDSGAVTSLTVDTPRHVQRAGGPKKQTFTPSDLGWASAFNNARRGLVNELKGHWDGGYATIPWFRMALRTWKPVADSQIAVGAPLGRPTAYDYADKPAILGG
jgi:hypothetical protein